MHCLTSLRFRLLVCAGLLVVMIGGLIPLIHAFQKLDQERGANPPEMAAAINRAIPLLSQSGLGFFALLFFGVNTISHAIRRKQRGSE